MIHESSIWLITDSDEYPIQCESRSILAEYPCHSHHPSLDLCHLGEIVEYYIRVLFCLFYPDILSSDLVCSDQYMYLTTDLSEIECLSDRRITTTDDCYLESSEEVAITGRTV